MIYIDEAEEFGIPENGWNPKPKNSFFQPNSADKLSTKKPSTGLWMVLYLIRIFN
jgi:hypothetical protein